MAKLGTKENPFSSFNELKKSDVYYSGDRAVEEVEKRLNRKLLPEEKRIIKLEGFVDGYYQDSKGVLTRGVGQTGTYAEGETSLSGFDNAYQEHINRLKAREGMASFDNYSPSLRQELVQAEYRGDLGQSPTFRKILSTAKTPQDYEKAATEFLRNEDYINAKKSGSGVANRMEAVANAVRQEGVALQEKPGFYDRFTSGIKELLPFNKGGNVDEITLNTIDVIEPDMYKNYRMQEAARRSMMQGNEEERMADYDYARDYAEDYPYLYPRRARSVTRPPMQAAQRMMGGFAQGGVVDQAQGLASLGRGGDSTLVHMQPREVAGLQQLAQANGTSLTRNPMTGMPEAFSLGGMFKAALPIAAGYFAPGSQFLTGAAGLGMSAGTASLAAGALTGAGVAAATGDDPIMGAVSGGLGGMSGGGLEGAFTGVGDAFTGANLPPAGSTLPQAAKGASMMTDPSLIASAPTKGFQAAGNKFMDNISNITGTDEMKPFTGAVQGSDRMIDGQFMRPTGERIPGGFLAKAKTIGSPIASLGLGGLEQSDFEVDVDFDDPRDKYDPRSKLDLSRDTGVSEAMSRDTGLRLLAKGGEVPTDVPASESVNDNSQGVNLNTVGGGAPPVPPSAMKLVAQAGTSGNKTSPFGGYQGMIPDDFNAQAGGYNKPNYTRNPYSGEFNITPYHDNFNPRGLDRNNNPFEPFRTFGYKNKPDPTSPTMTRPNPSYSPATMTRAQYDATLNLDEPDSFAKGGYLKGPGDGMSDDIPATINGKQPAALADGEFVVPADVVSHLGNGSSEAGSKQLYAMMDRIRKARTGKKSQGKEIKPGKYMPR